MAAPGPRWFPAPRAGDIVWCRFPQRGVAGAGPKPRPALVVRAGESGGRPVAEVAYGTSQKVDLLYAGEFVIAPGDGAAFAASGLSYPTKFDLGETFELDFNDIWFSVPPGAPHGQTPKLGILHPSLMRRAEAAARAAKNPR
ncbi:MAG: hypothetical protein A3F74_15495 [Betaproteobacteria bacterium RIFCSPLOWO2_12_FULL_62_58]|nr:MAG: hypothetical protein A3F74_15495 [Betaproteobacteria bacterium RIFCSPLOWO2_12_FULL_62_58]